MSEFPEEILSDQLRTVTAITTDANPLQLGDAIADGHVRKITRIHVPADPAPATREVEIYLGSTNNPTSQLIDNIVVISGNPDHHENAHSLRSPLKTVRPDETAAADADVLDKLYIQRVGATNVRVTIEFYDERA